MFIYIWWLQDPLAVTWVACSHKAENPVVLASLERCLGVNVICRVWRPFLCWLYSDPEEFGRHHMLYCIDVVPPSLVPRPSTSPGFACLQYAKKRGRWPGESYHVICRRAYSRYIWVQLHDVTYDNVFWPHEQKGWGRGRWVGAPEECKQHGRISCRLVLGGPFLSFSP